MTKPKTKTEIVPMKSLREKAMLVKFRDGAWGGSCRDAVVQKKVALDYETKKEKIGYYSKFLVPRETLEARIQKGLEARRFHNANTLPWLDDGVRVLPATNFLDYSAGMRKFQAEAQKEEQEIFKNWDAIKASGMLLLGKMAKEEDYPSLEQLKTKFTFEMVMLPVPETADWRIDIPKSELENIQQQAEKTLADIQTAAVTELWERLLDVVEHCHTRLDKEDSTFRNSLFENIKKITTLLPKLNIAENAALELTRKEVETKLAKQTPDEIRADPVLRKKVAKDASDIMKKMRSFMNAK